MLPARSCIRLSTSLLTRNILMAKQRPAPGVYFHITTETNNQSERREPFDLTQNPVYAKYAAKLEHLKATQPDLYNERIEKLRAMYEPEPVLDEGSSVDPPNQADQTSQTKPKSLDSIMKLELLADKSPEEIEQIWTEYHKQKDCIFATIQGNHYSEMKSRSEEFPVFLYPIPRQGGYEFFVQQYSDNTCHFTTLGAYQTHKENAPSCLKLEYFTDIQQDKDIVLMKGEPDLNILSVYEAQLLALQVKMYYGPNAGLKFNLVRLFNNNPADFRYMDLIKEFENCKKDSAVFREEYKQT